MCIKLPPKKKEKIVAGQKLLMLKKDSMFLKDSGRFYHYHPGIISLRNLKKGVKLIMGELRIVLAGNRSVQHPAIGA